MSTRPATSPTVGRRADKFSRVSAYAMATSEILFVWLPFIVIGIAFAHRAESKTLLFIPEWSIVSAVIVGQAIVKFASVGLGRSNVDKSLNSIDKSLMLLIISVLLVYLLAPILIILAITLTSPTVSFRLMIAQHVFFIISCVVFWFASAMVVYAENRDKDESDRLPRGPQNQPH